MNKSLIKSSFLVVIFVSLAIDAQDTSFYRSHRPNVKCRISEWQCDSGQCINFEERCDGIVNCRDGSDETSSACMWTTCPNYGFRCSYGACLNADVECNGIQNCADNSDELTLNCPGIVEDFKKEGYCQSFQFKCGSGECISKDSVCDGKVNCLDGSDETIQECLSSFCPSYGFRCGYGACISSFRRCDGVKDCVDGSDETELLCGLINKPIDRPQTTPNISIPMSNDWCRLDYIPSSGRVFYKDAADTELRLGDRIDSSKTIFYECGAQYALIGSASNKCVKGEWVNELPECSNYCDVVKITGISIKTTCEYHGSTIDCNGKLLPGTNARITCQYGYQKPLANVENVLVCQDDGKWNDTPFRCIEKCGTMDSPSTIGTSVPWYASIYYKLNAIGAFEFLCAGTILNAKIVITAANCFWNVSSDSFVSETNFVVGFGKTHRDYVSIEPNTPQFIAVTKIDHLPQFGSRPKLFYSDIAVLVLNDFIIFTPYIKPICFDPNLVRFQREIPINSTGLVATYTNDAQIHYQTSESRTINYYVCRDSLSSTVQKFLTNDKFCGQYVGKGSHLCKEDNGAGVIFHQQDGHSYRYFLRGVVFLSYLNSENCDRNSLLISTNIQYYSKMIMKNVYENPI